MKRCCRGSSVGVVVVGSRLVAPRPPCREADATGRRDDAAPQRTRRPEPPARRRSSDACS